MRDRQSVLFATYDGLLDPLGGSQVLPYLYGIREHEKRLHIVSFEKPSRFADGASELQAELAARGIGWTPLRFTARLGKVGKLWDLLRMYSACLVLQARHGFDVVHCRSYQAMQVGSFLSRVSGVKTIFDMRGLWVDDRVEGGLWRQDRWINRLLYRHYKKIEKRLLERADHVVVLTQRVVAELSRLAPDMRAPVSVIPCCADFDHFVRVPDSTRDSIRAEMDVDAGDIVISYLGSLGTVYLLRDMLRLFACLRERRGDVHMLIISWDWRDEHERLLDEMGLSHLRGLIHVKAAGRNQVPSLLCASDVMLSFRRNSYSQMACSPTKLAEALALGIPVVSNTGVGDVDRITAELDAGMTVDLESDRLCDDVYDHWDDIVTKGGESLRKRARKSLGLEVAHAAYGSVYAALVEKK